MTQMEHYSYESQQAKGYYENISFASFPCAPRCRHADVHLLVWLNETEANGSPDARPQMIAGPLDRVRAYAAVAPEWASSIGNGNCWNPGTHGRETIASAPPRIQTAAAALEAMQGQPGSTVWDYARELIAHEAASALTSLWYANRNVQGSIPLGADAIREVLTAVSSQEEPVR